MHAERNEGVGGLRGLLLATSFALVGAAYLLSPWVCEQYNVLTGEGEEVMLLTFVALPLTAGSLASFAVWRLGPAPAVVSGVSVCAGAFVAALMGC